MLGLQKGTVRLLPHDPTWAQLFEQEKVLLLKTFGDKIISVEHIGSTAVPGIPAKPIIDINVAIPSLEDTNVFVEELPRLGYEYMPERRFSDRLFFPKGAPDIRTHHLNLVEVTSETGWKNQLLFRDYLRGNLETRKHYQKLKEELAAKYADNRDEYTEQKSAFIMATIEKAKASAGM